MSRKQKDETPVVADALKLAKLMYAGGKVWRANSGGNKTGHKCNSENLPDIVGWDRDAVAVAWEVKTSTGRLTWDQLEFLQGVAICGGHAKVFAPGGVYDVHAIPQHHMPQGKRS